MRIIDCSVLCAGLHAWLHVCFSACLSFLSISTSLQHSSSLSFLLPFYLSIWFLPSHFLFLLILQFVRYATLPLHCHAICLPSTENQLIFYSIGTESDNVNKYSKYSPQTILRLWINFKRCKIKIVKNFGMHLCSSGFRMRSISIYMYDAMEESFEINSWSFDDSNAHIYILIEMQWKVNSNIGNREKKRTMIWDNKLLFT